MNTVTLEATRAEIGRIVERAHVARELTLITRYDRPAAVVIGYGQWEILRDEIASGNAGYMLCKTFPEAIPDPETSTESVEIPDPGES